MVSELESESSNELHENVYDSPCIWDEAIEDCGHDKDLSRRFACMIATVKGKKMEVDQVDDEGVMSDICSAFDKEDCTIMQSISNMVEGCCIFGGAMF